MEKEYRVIVSPVALNDLTLIAHYVAQDSPEQTRKVADAILTAMDSLAIMPARFPREGRRPRSSQFHVVVCFPYLIYYRIDTQKSAVHVVKIQHGARRPWRN